MGDPATIKDLEGVFSNLVGIIIGFAAIALFILLFIGGFKYMNSGGDPQKVAAARSTLTYALGGFFLIIMAFLILLLIQNLTGANVTEFNVTLP